MLGWVHVAGYLTESTRSARLLEGDWVHVFPEGRVNQSGTLLHPLRWGVGKLIASVTANSPSGLPPLVLPIYHTGRQE
jgi:monolysocardiolipin acyltransferase